MQLKLTIPSLRCQDCVNIVTKVATAVDLNATVEADLATQQVHIETQVSPEVLRHAITAAGYASVLA
jgi:copper chaperone